MHDLQMGIMDISESEWPSFLYPQGTSWDVEDDKTDLFRGYLLVTVSLIIIYMRIDQQVYYRFSVKFLLARGLQLHCPRVGLGQAKAIFAGPDPGLLTKYVLLIYLILYMTQMVSDTPFGPVLAIPISLSCICTPCHIGRLYKH